MRGVRGSHGRPRRVTIAARSPGRIASLAPGDHLCCLYDTEEEHRAVLTPFMRQGLECGEKVLYIVDARSAETVLGYLRVDGLSVESYVDRGQLIFLTADDAYTSEGVFDPDGMIAMLRTETERALTEGYAALRVTGEMSWVLRGPPGSERLIEYECKLNDFFPGSDCLAICQYDRRLFPPSLLLDVLCTHPIAVVGTEAYDNFYYMPPKEFLSRDPLAARLRHWVENLAERKRVEEALRASELELAIRNKIADIFLTVPDDEMYGEVLQVILQALQSQHGLFGYIDEEGAIVYPSMTRDVWDLCQVLDKSIAFPRETWGGIWGRALREKKTFYSNEPFRVPEGHIPMRRSMAVPIIHHGEVIGLLHVANKATDYDDKDQELLETIAGRVAPILDARLQRDRHERERKQAEEALRESEERFRFLAEHAQDVIYLLRFVPEAHYEYVNPSAQALTGYVPEEFYADPELRMRIVHPEDRPLYTEFIRSPQSFAGRPLILRRIRKDGTVIWTEQHNSLVFDEADNIVANIAIVRDISDRIRAEEELERLRSEFLGMVSHELRTPLTAIKGSAATALGSRTPLDARGYSELFEIIDEQAERLRDLVDQMLDMTRIEAGTLPVSPEPVDLRDIMKEAWTIFLHSGGQHALDIQVPDGLPCVWADSQRIVQVVTNLLNNAAQFSPPTAPIELVAEYDGVQVTVKVRDHGRGISPDKLPHLFKKFSRVHEDSGLKRGSTGLGLAISKGIIESHGGRIWADSAGEGQGATFSFTLPVAEKAAVSEGTAVAGGERIRRRGEKTRVLAVDDEPQILRYLQRSLKEAGHEALVTADPAEVAKLVELEEPDIVLLDLRLPGTSGFEVLRHIREFSGVPVIFLTASDRDEDVVRAFQMGVDDYIKKPFSPSELLARIEVALRRRGAAGREEVRQPFVLGELTVDFTERRVLLKNRPVSLSATEYKLLFELATHAGRVLTHKQILQRVWGPEYSGETELVRSFVRNLRRKLGDDARHPRFIFTEPQVGYRMPREQ
jgi:PAS domain S-box-containing protein